MSELFHEGRDRDVTASNYVTDDADGVCVACALNQSTDSQDLGRYLGFRLRCLDVDSSTERTPHSAAVPPLLDVTARLRECPHDGAGCGSSPLQSPTDGSVSRGAAGAVDGAASPSSHRRVASSAEHCNNVVNSRTADVRHVNNN